MRLNSNLKVNYISLNSSFFTAFLAKGTVIIFNPFPEINRTTNTCSQKYWGTIPVLSEGSASTQHKQDAYILHDFRLAGFISLAMYFQTKVVILFLKINK